jgi:hypothetical protein
MISTHTGGRLPRLIALGAIAALALVLASGCGGDNNDDNNSNNPATRDKTTTGPKARQPAPRRRGACLPASRGLVNAISRGLRGRSRGRVAFARVVRTRSVFPRAPAQIRRNALFVSGQIRDRRGKPEVATWITRDPNGRSVIYPAESFSADQSAYPGSRGARVFRLGIGRQSHGYKESRECVQNAAAKARRGTQDGSGGAE